MNLYEKRIRELFLFMNKIENLNKLQENLIYNFSEQELKNYIKYLVKNYYDYYLKNDEKNYENAYESILKVIEIHKHNYPNIIQFIYYNMVSYSNNLFSKAVNSDFELMDIVKSDLNENTIKNPFEIEFLKDLDKLKELRYWISKEAETRLMTSHIMKEQVEESSFRHIFYLDSEDHRIYRSLFERLKEMEDKLPEDVVELMTVLYENINETDPYIKTYHNFSVTSPIKEEFEDYYKKKDIRIKNLEKELKELKGLKGVESDEEH